MALYPAERTILMITCGFALVTALMIGLRGIEFQYAAFLGPLVIACPAFAIGQIFRVIWPAERVALTPMTVGLFAVIGLVFSTYNIVLLPRPTPPIDDVLVRIDAWFGYSWPEICAWAAQYPQFSDFLRWTYGQTVHVLFMVFICLSVFGNRRRLHITAYACLFALLIVIASWAYMPSSGASAHWTLDPKIEAIVKPVVNSAYGAELNRLLAEGVTDISKMNVTGLIGFPSYHTVMALVAVYAVWPYLPLRLISIVIVAFTLLGTLIHGGHNLVDVFGGIGITAFSWWLATWVHDAQDAAERVSLPNANPERG